MGIAREDNGGFSLLTRMCSGHVDGFTVYHSDGPDGDGTDHTEDFDVPVTSEARYDVTSLVRKLNPEIEEYSVYAWSTDNSSSARGPNFSTAQLSALSPGQILATNYADDSFGISALDTQGFEASVASYCDD